MIARASLLAALAPALSGCALWSGFAPTPACPDIRGADAWINRMPGPGRQDAALIVQVLLGSDTAWTLAPDAATTGDTLVLALSPGGKGVPGIAGYREKPPEPRRTAVSITCGGEEVAAIRTITIAQ